MFADRNQDLASHVSTLFGAGGLVLNVNTSGALLDEHLCELHDSGKTTMSGIGISDNRAEIVDIGNL